MDKTDVLKLALWSAPKEVNTKFGPRTVSKAKVPAGFWDLWRAQKDALKELGVSVAKNKDDQWEVFWWREIDDETAQARAEALVMSRAVSADVELPHPEGYDYMPFQKAGILYGMNRPHTLLADEPGLGKTIQAIGLINTIIDIESAVIICPKSLKLNWKIEIGNWLTRNLTVGVIGKNWVDANIVILNYDSLGKWMEHIKARGQWGAVIIDEAHLIKSRVAIRSKLSKSIDTRHKIRLTGTPIVNRPKDLYNLIEDMADFGTFFQFAKRYAGGTKGRFGWDFSGATNLPELQQKLREKIMVRRLKDEVLKELPRKIRQVIELEPDDAASRQAVKREIEYEAELDFRLAELRAIVEISKAESEQSYRVAVENLRTANSIEFSQRTRIKHETGLAKLQQINNYIDTIMEDNDEKLVIAAHHRDVISGYVAHAEAMGWNPVYIMGGMDEQDRQDAKERFQTDPTCRVFVASIQAAGVGITLTAANQMVVAELPDTPAELTQVEDRLHRLGQLKTVLIQHLVLAGSIDASTARMLVEKQKIADQALDVEHFSHAISSEKNSIYPDSLGLQSEGRKKSASASLDVQEIQDEAAKITPEEIDDILSKLNFLAALDNDRAEQPNGVGFSKVDSAIGHSLVNQGYLTPKQAVIGRQIVKKYHRQLEMRL